MPCPEFVLLDIGLPVMDGYEVARQLRGDPRLRDAVIVAVSGYSQDDYRHPEEAGFDHHMVKPIDYDALRAILSRPR
jgi:CheY-like chemotaxis protein